MASLRPSFQTFTRTLRTSPLTAAARSVSTSAQAQAAKPGIASRLAGPSTIRTPLSASSVAPLARTPSALQQQQVRGVRNSPFRINVNGSTGGGGGAGRFAFAAPHAAPAADAPTSFSQTGGWQRALTSLGIIGGTAFAANLFFNRETRESALHPADAGYLHSTFKYLGGGLLLTGTAAVALHRYGVSARVMTANPWLVLGGGLVLSIGSMMAATSLPPGHAMKVPAWLAFNASQALVLSPLLFLNPAVLSRAALYTSGLMGSLIYVAATARDDKFLWLGGPLLAGLTVVALSSLAPMLLPRTAFRTLAVTESLSLYGGLVVFGGLTLVDTQRILKRAEMIRHGHGVADPLAESISLELTFINLFVRIVQLLGMQQSRRK